MAHGVPAGKEAAMKGGPSLFIVLFHWFRLEKSSKDRRHDMTIDWARWNRVAGPLFMRETPLGAWRRERWIKRWLNK